MGLLKEAGLNDDRKPLYAVWLKGNKNPDPLPVLSIKMSSSEMWLMVETEETMTLFPLKSAAVQALWEQVQTFEGALVGLVVVPAKNKFSCDIEIGEEVGCWVQGFDEITWSSGTKTKKQSGMHGITLEALQQATQSTLKPDTTDATTKPSGKRLSQSKSTIGDTSASPTT